MSPDPAADEAALRLFDGAGEEVGTCDEDPDSPGFEEGRRALLGALRRGGIRPSPRWVRERLRRRGEKGSLTTRGGPEGLIAGSRDPAIS